MNGLFTVKLNTIICGDAEKELAWLKEDSVDLIVTSPPYSDLRRYGQNSIYDIWSEAKFKNIALLLKKVLKNGGVIVWIVNDKTENGSKSLVSFRQALYFQEIGFNVNDVMIWSKKNPMPVVRQPRYQDVFEYMFVFSKGKPKTFNPIMVPCKCAGQIYDSTTKNMDIETGRTHKKFNINKEKVKGNVWDIAVAQNKTAHPAVCPEELVTDHILSWSNEGDVVLDPFMGSGTTALACIKTNRKYIGIEINDEYVEMANNRINLFNKKNEN